MKSRVALIKGDDRRDNIHRAMDLVKEDIKSKINGRDIIIKPNCLRATAPLSCTHVDALRGILDFVSNLSPESTIIAESCIDHEPLESFKGLGYTSLPHEYGISLVELETEDSWGEIYLLNSDHQEVKARIARTLLDCECRISAAVAKTHDVITVTASWKNMMGALALSDKVRMHGCTNHRERILTSEMAILPQNLLRLAKLVPPHIGVIDGFIGMEGNGPVRGSENHLGIAIASADFVAADAVCAKVMGFEPMDISYLNYANQLGLGTASLDDIEVIGESIEDVAGKFIPHSNYPTQRLWKELPPTLP